MLDWIAANHEVLTLAVNFGMLVVWLTYLHVFLEGYRRQVRPKIVINRGTGEGMDARCFVSNMGSDAIYLEDIRLTVSAGGDDWRGSVLDLGNVGHARDGDDPKSLTHQGTLGAGSYTIIGAYGELVDHVLAQSRAPGLEALVKRGGEVRLRVEVLADHAADDLLIAARRRFRVIEEGGRPALACLTLETEQVRSRRARRDLRRTFAEELGVRSLDQRQADQG